MAGELPLPPSLAGAVGRFSVLEGRGDEALLLVWLDNLEAAHRWRAKRWLVRSRAARRRRLNIARGKQNGWWPPLVMSRCRDREASPCGAATTNGHWRRAALCVVSLVNG
jgi:hypothetical protein